MSVSCEKEVSINVINPCALFDGTFVDQVNSIFGTAWDGTVVGAWNSAGGMEFDCPKFNIKGGVTGNLFWTFTDKVAAPGVCNPNTTILSSSTPYTRWQWNNFNFGCPMHDKGIPEYSFVFQCGTDNCGASSNVLHAPEAYAFYLSLGRPDHGGNLIKSTGGGVTYWGATDVPMPGATEGFFVSSLGNLIMIDPAAIHNVQYVKDSAIAGCPIGSYHFTTVTFGPPPPPPAIPATLFITQ